MIALVLHDMGYVRGACAGDTPASVVVSESGARADVARGASDGALGPHHVARSMIHARERLAARPQIDMERIVHAIGCTQFPPSAERPIAPASEGGLVRAADLISQLGDPRYVPRMTALYAEFRETGQTEAFGYRSAADLVDRMPAFHRETATPLIGPALDHLAKTPEGRLWCMRIDYNLALAADPARFVGPARGPDPN